MLRVGCCPPVVRRGEGTRSGAPSWTTAQTQAVQGCTVCVVPPDLLPEPREPDAGGRTSGGGLSFGDFSLATQRKVTRQAAQRRRNPIEDGVLVSCAAKPCHGGVGRHCTRQCRYPPLTLALSRKGGGDQTEVAEAGGRNPVEDGVLVSCTAKPCHSHVGRHSPGNDVTHPSP